MIAISATMLESTAIVQKPTIGRDSASGVTQNPFVTVASNLPCSQQASGITIAILYAQRNVQNSGTIYFPSNPGVDVNYRIICTDNVSGTRTYFIAQGEAQPAARGQLWNVDVIRIKAPDSTGL